jgi:hypothetical protein
VLNQELMKEIDKYFLEHPYYGVERMTTYLNMDLGYNVTIKRVRRLFTEQQEPLLEIRLNMYIRICCAI